MKKVIVIFVLILFSCTKDEENNEIPDCLKPIIEGILERPVQSPKAKIEKWQQYQNKEVLSIDAQNFPDGQAFIITSDCQGICALGGLDGPANDCENWDRAEFIEVIWTDPRWVLVPPSPNLTPILALAYPLLTASKRGNQGVRLGRSKWKVWRW